MFDDLRNLLALPRNALACKRNLKRSGLQPETHVFARPEGDDLKLDLYRPDSAAMPCPVILFLHGGGWSAGDRTLIEPLALAQVARGFALASIDYRLTGTAIWPAQLYDARAAMRWLRRNGISLGLDPGRICVFGVSAGGHLAALLGTASDKGPGAELIEDGVGVTPDAVIAFYPPTDFLCAKPVGPRFMQAQAPNSPQAKLLGAPLKSAVAAARSANPISWIDGSEPPYLLLHGDADRLVDPGQSALLAEALERAGSRVAFHLAPGLHHADMRFNHGPWRAIVESFLDELCASPAHFQLPKAENPA